MSIFSTIGNAAKSYVSNVVGGAKIVGNAVKSLITPKSSTALQASIGQGMTPQQTAKAVAITTPNRQVTSGGLTYAAKDAPAISSLSSSYSSPLNVSSAIKSGGLTLDPTPTQKMVAPTSSSYSAPTLSSTSNAFQTPASFTSPTTTSNVGSYLGASSLNSGSTVGTPASQIGAEAPISALEQENKKREEETRKSQNDLIAMMNELAGKPVEAVKLEEQAGLPQANAELRDLQAKQTLQTAQYMQQMQDIQNKPIAMEFIAGQQGEVARRAGIDAMITSALIQSKTGQIQTAQDTVDRALSMKYDPLIQRMDFQKQIIQMNYNELSRSDKKLADERTAKLATETKKLDQLMTFQNNAIKNAMQNGAPSNVINNIMNSKSVGEVSQYGGNYIVSEADRLELEIQKLQKQKLSKEISGMGTTSNKLLSVAEAAAAGVPYGTTEAQLIAQGGVPKVDISKAQASINNLERLKQTATKASALYKGAGRTWAHEAAAGLFTLSEKKRLTNLSDTLKVNILTMNTDPGIKKFFGPQMTERDTQLMTAAGTTLNPDLQTPEEYKAEVSDLYDMFNRAQLAVKEGLQKEQLSSFIDVSGKALQVVNSPYLKQ